MMRSGGAKRLTISAIATTMVLGFAGGAAQQTAGYALHASGTDAWAYRELVAIMDRAAEALTSTSFLILTALMVGAAVYAWSDFAWRRWGAQRTEKPSVSALNGKVGAVDAHEINAMPAIEAAHAARNAMSVGPRFATYENDDRSDDEKLFYYFRFIAGLISRAGYRDENGAIRTIPLHEFQGGKFVVKDGQVIFVQKDGTEFKDLYLLRNEVERLIEEHREWAFREGPFRGLLVVDSHDIKVTQSKGTAGFYRSSKIEFDNHDFGTNDESKREPKR